MKAPPINFATLDLLRGFAAIGVMAFHEHLFARHWMPGGYLAVDLFFLMSGFVIAHAYAGRMADGMDLRSFFYARAVRLWPMLFLGALLGIVLHAGHVGSLFLLPDWRSPGNLFPSNPSLWSLVFEAFAYVAFALGGWRLSTRALGGIVAFSLMALIGLAATGEPISEFGPHWPTFAGGFARIGFGFVGGMLLYRFWRRKPPPRRKTLLAWLLPLVLSIFMVVVRPDANWSAVVTVAVALPAIVWLALGWEVPQSTTARLLGSLSYPLYCIHVPIIALVANDGSSTLITIASLPLAALALERFADRPARAALSRWIAHDTAVGPQTRIGIST